VIVGLLNLMKISYKTTAGLLQMEDFLCVAVLTLNFDLDLSKVNGNIWHQQIRVVPDSIISNPAGAGLGQILELKCQIQPDLEPDTDLGRTCFGVTEQYA